MNKPVLDSYVLTLKNSCSESSKLTDFLATCTSTFEISGDTCHDLRLVIEEIFINIVNYAYAKKDDQIVTVEFKRNIKEISITFSDTGIAFNPLTKPAEGKTSDDHCEGGMGIHIITSLTNHQEYNRVGQSNVFTVTKHYTR